MQRITASNNKLRLGFVGGGVDSWIGPVHRYAANLDGNFDVIAGVFSRDATRNQLAAKNFGIEPARVYSNYVDMARAEAARSDGIQAVSIMTPNATHAAIARVFIDAGIAVICDKPLASRLDDAVALAAQCAEKRALFILTFNYSGYPMVREARERIAAGEIGTVRVVQVQHAASSGVDPVEMQGSKSMVWRTDPQEVGDSAVLADVGVHAHHLARFVTGLEVSEVSAELSTMVPGRASDDNAHLMLRFNSGARGTLWASFIAAGNRHGLRIQVIGSTGSLIWDQEHPDQLLICPQHGPHITLRRGEAWLSQASLLSTRTKCGQPEGFLEAFANIYSDAAELIRARCEQRLPDQRSGLAPGIVDGLRGMELIDAAVRSQRSAGAWTTVREVTI